MKKNILITILIIIIIVLIYKILNPSVVTQRKTINLNETEQENVLTNNYEETNTDNKNKSPLIPEFRLNDDVATNNYKTGNNNFAERMTQTTDNHTDHNQKDLSGNSAYKYAPQSRFPEPPNDSAIYRPDNKAFNNNEPYNHIPSNKPKTFESSLSMCYPYNETLTTEYMGMKMKYTINILGWVNNKCILNFEANMLNTGTSFEDTYGFATDSAQIFGFAPKIRCEFTKQQLLYVGDNILEEKNREQKMLKNPNDIEFPDFKDMTFSDVKLLQIILNDKACKILNTEDFAKIFEGLFDF